MSRSHVDMFDSDELSNGRLSEGGSSGFLGDKTGSGFLARIEQRRRQREEAVSGSGTAEAQKDGSYASAFAVGGSLDMSNLQGSDDSYGQPNWSANTSRAISRLSSRLGTPSGSRSSSRIHSRLASRHGSRHGSNAGSLAVSRVGSRAGSRFVSPARTPLTGGGGALPRVLSGLHSGVGGGLRSGAATPRAAASGTPLRDLKSALINAAGSMGGIGRTKKEEATEGRGRGVNVTQTVYLGSLRLEYYEVGEGKDGRGTSSGRDGDFFNMGPPLLSLRPTPPPASPSKFRRKRSLINFRP